METVATAQPKPNKSPSTLLIVVLIIVLIGGGVGAYFLLKPKADDGGNNSNNNNNNGDDEGGANGRNVTNHRFPLTPEQIAALVESQAPGPTPGKVGSSPTNPIFYRDPEFLIAIEEEAKRMQSETSSEQMDAIRALYNIGEPMMGRDVPEQECIEHLFSQLPNVDFTSNPNRKYLQFPVYGTYEPKGRRYRAELQNIVNSGWQGLNLTHLRDDQAPWWCEEIGLNLLVGTTWSNTPSVHNTIVSFAPRNELDFFKKFNRHWVDDRYLGDKYVDKRNSSLMILLYENNPNARAAYCATGMYQFVIRWIAEIDRLDKMTKKEAFENLITVKPDDPDHKTWYVTYRNPATGVDESKSKGDKMSGNS